MKGKKFDAHKKHFEEKEIKLRKETKYYIELAEKIVKENDLLLKENSQLKKENEDIKEKYEKLLEYSKLSENDIITALHKDIVITQFAGMMGTASKYL